jgi:hypothetical protein
MLSVPVVEMAGFDNPHITPSPFPDRLPTRWRFVAATILDRPRPKIVVCKAHFEDISACLLEPVISRSDFSRNPASSR